MTQITERPPAPPLTDDHDVLALADELVGPAIRQQLWLLILDGERRPLPMLIPIEDTPMTGTPADAERFSVAVAGLCGATGGSALVLVWERPGQADATEAERSWAQALERAVTSRGVPIAAQVLSHDRGVAVLRIDG